MDITTCFANAQSTKTIVSQLRKFHNEVKLLLLKRFAKKGNNLLDIGCGSGGDMWKWDDVKLKYVHGLDVTPESITRAQNRYIEMCRSRGPRQTEWCFEVNDQIGKLWRCSSPGTYDVVSCMFALNYFFQSETMLRNLLNQISISLKYGGYFIGVCIDGEGIMNHVEKKKDNSVLTVVPSWIEKSDFGQSYQFSLQGTVMETPPLEYCIYEDVLQSECLKVNLMAVKEPFQMRSIWGCPPKGSVLSMKHGCLRNVTTDRLRTDELYVSSLTSVFAFKKTK